MRRTSCCSASQRVRCSASCPPGLACAKKMRSAKRAARLLRASAASSVRRCGRVESLTTAILPATSASRQPLHNEALTTGRPRATMTGLRDSTRSRSTDCSSGEWNPPITVRRSVACCNAHSVAARMAVPGHRRDAKNATNGPCKTVTAPTPATVSPCRSARQEAVVAGGLQIMAMRFQGSNSPRLLVAPSGQPCAHPPLANAAAVAAGGESKQGAAAHDRKKNSHPSG